jgi:hypothetical protein
MFRQTAPIQCGPAVAGAAVDQQGKAILREVGERIAVYGFHRCILAWQPNPNQDTSAAE